MGDQKCIQKFWQKKKKFERKRPLRRTRHSWENNIKIDLTKTGHISMWTGFIWLRIGSSGRHLVNMVMNLQVL